MKSIAAISIIICALIVACTNHLDDKDFIRNMYENSLYFVILDCGSFPNDPYVTIRKGQQSYIEKLKDGRKDFFQLNTRVTIEHGKITEIHRKWIP